MKRVKIILSAITVLAAVGGALAFKANTFSTRYCYGQKGTNNCPNGITTTFAAPNGVAITYVYTTTTNIANCSSLVECNKLGRTVVEP